APPVVMSVFSSTPCLGWGGLLLIAGPGEALAPIRARAESDPELQPRMVDLARLPRDTRVTTDDWPYLYLPAPGVPRYHLLVGLACLALGVRLRRSLFKPGEPVDAAMLLLGMGFMLLEVSGVSRAALLLGATWTVNAYVVGAMLIMILLANLTVQRLAPEPAGWPSLGLVLSLLALALAPMAAIAGLPL